MAIVANLVSVYDMGKVSAVYVMVMTCGQIFGYSLSMLALEQDDSTSIASKKERIFSCIVLWVIVSSLTFALFVTFKHHLMKIYFQSAIDDFTYYIAIVWICSFALEMLNTSVGISNKSIRQYAIFCSIQLASIIVLTPIAVTALGSSGIVIIIISPFFGSLVVFGKILSSNGGVSLRGLIQRIRSSISGLFSSSFLAAALLTSLNILMVQHALYADSSLKMAAEFSIAIQILAISSFLPQVLYNYDISRISRFDRTTARSAILKGSLLSFFLSGFIGIIIYVLNPFVSYIYGPNYAEMSDTIFGAALALTFMGPLQILTYGFIVEKQPWNIVLVSLSSSVSGYIYYILYFENNSSHMLFSIFVANLVRGGHTLILLYLENVKAWLAQKRTSV